METPLSKRLNELLPAINGHWATLLKAKLNPVHSTGGSVTAGMLALILDPTLARLLVRVIQFKPSVAPTFTHDFRRKRPSDNCGRCGLHLLLNCQRAGARALRDVLPRNRGEDRILISHCLNSLAYEEIARLASAGHFNGSESCGLLLAEPPAVTGKSLASYAVTHERRAS